MFTQIKKAVTIVKQLLRGKTDEELSEIREHVQECMDIGNDVMEEVKDVIDEMGDVVKTTTELISEMDLVATLTSALVLRLWGNNDTRAVYPPSIETLLEQGAQQLS